MGTRTLVLVRHGQYEPETGSLTVLGRKQAVATARYLETWLEERAIAVMWSSTMPRARETADILSTHLGKPPLRAVGVLREGLYTKVDGYDATASERREDCARATAAYGRIFRTSRFDRTEIVVCHGNLIRFLVCKALRTPVTKWLRMNTNHCAMTRILVRDTGAVRVVSYNETSHLAPKLVT